MQMKSFLSVMMALMLVLSLVLPAMAAQNESVTILFTHDMHSHLSAQPEGDGTRGGFARLKTLIDREKA